MRPIGVHTSIAGGIEKSIERAVHLGCSTVQVFSHNPRAWHVKQKTAEEGETFRRLRRLSGVGPVFIHCSYLINLASRDSGLLDKSVRMVVEEMNIADLIGADYLVLHTGSAAGDDPRESRRRAASALSEVAERGNWRAGILIENTAGERGDITSRLAEIASITEQVRGKVLSGICIDTCHAFAAGYDIASVDGLAAYTEELDKYIGRRKIRLIHLNDSKGALGSGLDRHEHIGKGKIGIMGFTHFLGHPYFAGIPIILETPKRTEGDDPANLETVRNMIREVSQSQKQ